jgi:hypothetical protein
MVVQIFFIRIRTFFYQSYRAAYLNFYDPFSGFALKALKVAQELELFCSFTYNTI